MNDTSRSELFRLLAECLDDTIRDESHRRLEQLLVASAEARQAYIDHLDLVANLLWEHRQPNIPEGELFTGEANRQDSEPSRDCVLSDTSGNAVVRIARRSTTAVLNWPVLLSICGVSVLFAGYFLAISWNMLSRQARDAGPQPVADSSDLQPRASSLRTDAVATISSTQDARWISKFESGNRKPEIVPGESLQLASGVVEVKLQQGTTLLFEGPARWSVRDSNRVSLQSGKVVAMVPEQAIGFRVETPNAQIVDLGTEFGVEVSESGATEVQVFRGKVSLRSEASATARRHSAEVLLSAGEARKVEAAASGAIPQITEVPWRPRNFIHLAGASDKVGRIRVGGALASSEFGVFCVNNLINQSGVSGSRHTSSMRLPSGQYTMWSSAAGREKNEYVLFDLGATYQLSKVRIWNYNDRHHGARGASRVDICVASSSIGDPVSTPERWKRVVVDQKLNCAPGTDAYDTPDEVPLDDVVTRYLGIVIKDCCPPEKSNPPGFYQCVGLSEVEIYGSKVVPRSHEP